MSLALAVGAVILAALVIYTLTGGADFGGGVWDLLASGPRREAQRRLVADAIAPIWEANHVWLIVVVVLLFVCFPKAFAAVSIALHVPLLVMLIGIVLRGTSFTFRAYGHADETERARWGLIFSVSSLLTPVMLGVCLGAVATGRIRVDPASGRVLTDFVSAWWGPFPFAVGLFVLVLFAYLAAVYLAVEAQDPALREDFRRRALASGVLLGPIALLAWLVAAEGAPRVYEGLAERWWSIPLQVGTGAAALGALVALWRGRVAVARLFAVCQAALIVVGLGGSMFPYVVVPDLTLHAAAAPDTVLRASLWVLAVGGVLLVPAFVYLFRIFKSRPA